jgi:uncharacterized protein (TIGR02147 family)
MTIYLVNSYREFLEKKIFANKHVRGYKSRLATAAGCHSSYLSQVLKGSVDLSLDQAMNIADFWRLDENETDFFLDLLLRDRAGNPKLRDFYEHRLRRGRETRDIIAGMYGKCTTLPLEAATLYYSSWHFAAVQVLAVTPEYSSVDRMASRLRLAPSMIKEALASLEAMGVIAKDGDRWVEVGEGIYLPRNSPMNSTNHINWRQRAIANIQVRDLEALHLLHLCNISRRDFAKVKAKLAECLEDIRQIAESSGKDDAVAVSLDFLRI